MMNKKPDETEFGKIFIEEPQAEPRGGVRPDLNWDDVAESVLVAQVLVTQYGADAPLKAEASASRLLLDWADLEAWAYWKRAGRMAEQMLLTEPTGAIH